MRISDWSSDVCSSDLRQERLLYTRPYYQVPQAIVVREQHAGVATPAGLATQRVAVMARTSQVGYLRRHHPHVEIVEAQTMLDLMSAVLSGKADLLIATLPVVQHFMAANPLGCLRLPRVFQSHALDLLHTDVAYAPPRTDQ